MTNIRIFIQFSSNFNEPVTPCSEINPRNSSSKPGNKKCIDKLYKASICQTIKANVFKATFCTYNVESLQFELSKINFENLFV